MTQQTINPSNSTPYDHNTDPTNNYDNNHVVRIGSENGGNGDPLRVAFKKINTAFDKIDSNFSELYALSGGTNLEELAQDYASAMITSGTHSGISVSYDDQNNILNLTVNIDGGSASTNF
jgi:hypothetical protein